MQEKKSTYKNHPYYDHNFTIHRIQSNTSYSITIVDLDGEVDEEVPPQGGEAASWRGASPWVHGSS